MDLPEYSERWFFGCNVCLNMENNLHGEACRYDIRNFEPIDLQTSSHEFNDNLMKAVIRIGHYDCFVMINRFVKVDHEHLKLCILFGSIEKDKIRIFDSILSRVDLNFVDRYYITIVNAALQEENVHYFKSLLENGLVILPNLILECFQHDIKNRITPEKIDLLVKYGWNVNVNEIQIEENRKREEYLRLTSLNHLILSPDDKLSNFTPLAYTVHFGNMESSEKLIDHGADVNVIYDNKPLYDHPIVKKILEETELTKGVFPEICSEN